jgi:hypothetical protein
MCRGTCPVCGSYSCHCSDYRLREYQRDHEFDRPSGSVLSRWAQDDRSERVECELRDRRRHEMEAEEQRAADERKAAQQRQEARERGEAEYYAQQQEAEYAAYLESVEANRIEEERQVAEQPFDAPLV